MVTVEAVATAAAAQPVARNEVLPLVANTGQGAHLEDLPLVANDEDIELGQEINDVGKGWRLEANSNGFYRWRWQMKDATGKPLTYETAGGKTGYKRGSKYVGKKPD